VTIEVWRHGGLGRAQAEDAAGGVPAGCGDAQGDVRKKLLTPRARKLAVSWAIKDKGYMQRGASGLVGLEPKTYREAGL
jgi:hypothetical protein